MFCLVVAFLNEFIISMKQSPKQLSTDLCLWSEHGGTADIHDGHHCSVRRVATRSPARPTQSQQRLRDLARLLHDLCRRGQSHK